jgi:hypothetical protein
MEFFTNPPRMLVPTGIEIGWSGFDERGKDDAVNRVMIVR